MTLVLCQSSMLSSHGQVSSMRIPLFSLLEKIVLPNFSSVNAMWGGKEKVPSRSTNATQSDAWCKIPLREGFLFFNLVPFFTNFIFLGCFEVGTIDLVFLIKDLILTMMIFKTPTWWKVISPKITQIFSTKSILP